MKQRIEILKNDIWYPLKLETEKSVKYNVVINRIGKIGQREISHSNTFSVPNISQNLKALDLTKFNPGKMARSLNKKYQAKYYIDDILLKTGFLVINNLQENKINVNFIEGSLHLVEKWGTLTYHQLLTLDGIDRPTDYQAAIEELKNYHMDSSDILASTSQVGSRGYKLAVFPNNLNAIGDRFQKIDKNGSDHIKDSFNPYQSRPVFGIQALIDLATESFGYTVEMDQSVDFPVVKKSFVIAEKLNDGAKTETSLLNIVSPIVDSEESYHASCGEDEQGNYSCNVDAVFVYADTNNTKRIKDISHWENPPGMSLPSDSSKRAIYVPDFYNGDSGKVHFQAKTTKQASCHCYALYKNDTSGNNIVNKLLPVVADSSTDVLIDFEVNKSDVVDNPPDHAGDFIGLIVSAYWGNDEDSSEFLEDLRVVEQYVPIGVVSFDKFGQYAEEYVDLNFGAPKKTIKELLAGFMQKEGLLIQILPEEKKVKFFTYKQYQTARDLGDYYDWSKYLQKYSGIYYNTNYGNDYGKTNRVGLSEPFFGNTHDIILSNQGEDSKYKDFAENYVDTFRDVSKVLKVKGSDNDHTYYEFTNKGQGLVEQEGSIPSLNQIRANWDDSVSPNPGVIGEINDLEKIENVNYLDLPSGVSNWYELIDKAVRIEAPYLLPLSVVRDFDISKPIYDEFLGGFFIVEEIPEYIDSKTLVRVKLIKLIDFQS